MDKTLRWFMKRLGIEEEIKGEKILLTTERPPSDEFGIFRSGEITIFAKNKRGNLRSPELISRTFVHEIAHKYHYDEVGAHMAEILWMLYSHWKKGASPEMLKKMRRELYSWMMHSLLSTYSYLRNAPFWEVLAIKKAFRNSLSAYETPEVYIGQNLRGLLSLDISPSLLASAFTFYSPLDLLERSKNIDSATYIPPERRKDIAKKLWIAAKKILETTEKPTKSRLAILARVILLKQILEGKRRFDPKELKALVTAAKGNRKLIRKKLYELFFREAAKVASTPLVIPPAMKKEISREHTEQI